MAAAALILLADDEPPVTHVLGLKLRSMGFEVITARDGEEGFELACERQPDAVVTDFQMPVQSGFEMAVRLRNHEPTANTPVLMLTARGHTLNQQELTQTNIERLMDKPFSANELSRAVEQMVGSKDLAADE